MPTILELLKLTTSLDPSGFRDLKKEMDDASSGADKTGGAFSKMGTAASAGVAGLAVAGSAVAAAAISAVNEVQQAGKQMQAQLGVSAEEAKALSADVKQVYKNNFGGSITEVGQAVTEVRRAYRDLNEEVTGSTQNATENAIRLRDTFGVDIKESLSATRSLMDNFGLSSQQAFDMLTRGYQRGLDRSGDFLDTINEYSTQFKNGNFSAEQMFNTLESGAAGGSLGVDRIADAVKEFNIRITEMADPTKKALGEIGLNATDISKRIADGTLTQAQAWEMVTGALSKTTDETARFRAGQAIIGTQFEDLGASFVEFASSAGNAYADVSGATKSLDVQYESLGAVFESLKRRAIIDFLVPLGDGLLLLINTGVKAFKEAWQDIGPVVSAVWSGIQAGLGRLDGLLQPVGAQLRSVWEQVGPQAQAVFNGILAAAQAVIAFFVAQWPMIEAAATVVFGKIRDYVLPVVAEIQQTWEVYRQKFQEVMQSLEPFFAQVGGWTRELGESTRATLDFIGAHWREVWGALEPIVRPVFDTIRVIVETGMELLQQTIMLVLNLLQGDWRGAWENLKNIVEAVLKAGAEILRNSLEMWKAVLALAWEGIKLAAEAFWNELKASLANLWAQITNEAQVSWEHFKQAIISAVQSAADWLFGSDGPRSWPGRLAEAVSPIVGRMGEIARSAVDAFTSPFRGMAGSLQGPINAGIAVIDSFIRGVNMITGALGIPQIPEIGGVSFGGSGSGAGGGGGGALLAMGDEINRPTMAIVGEDAPRFREWVIPENPAYHARAMSLWLSAGRGLGMPGFQEGGIIGAIQSAAGGAVGGLGDLANMIKQGPKWVVNQLASVLNPLDNLPGLGGEIARGAARVIKDGVLNLITGALDKAKEQQEAIQVSGGGMEVPGATEGAPDSPSIAQYADGGRIGYIAGARNIGEAGARAALAQAMGILGISMGEEDIARYMHRLSIESGFNTGVVNLWDRNAQSGTPSIGIAQTIGPTFRTWMQPGYGNIGDPVHNILASLRYIGATYGRGNIVAGIRNLPSGGYAQGEVIRSPQLAMVGEDAPRWAEVVIPENPAYRSRAIGLWAKAGRMLGLPGFQAGGIVGATDPNQEMAFLRRLQAILEQLPEDVRNAIRGIGIAPGSDLVNRGRHAEFDPNSASILFSRDLLNEIEQWQDFVISHETGHVAAWVRAGDLGEGAANQFAASMGHAESVAQAAIAAAGGENFNPVAGSRLGFTVQDLLSFGTGMEETTPKVEQLSQSLLDFTSNQAQLPPSIEEGQKAIQEIDLAVAKLNHELAYTDPYSERATAIKGDIAVLEAWKGQLQSGITILQAEKAAQEASKTAWDGVIEAREKFQQQEAQLSRLGEGGAGLADLLKTALGPGARPEQGAAAYQGLEQFIAGLDEVLGPTATETGENLRYLFWQAFNADSPEVREAAQGQFENILAGVNETMKAQGELTADTFGAAVAESMQQMDLAERVGPMFTPLFDALQESVDTNSPALVQKIGQMSAGIERELKTLPEQLSGPLLEQWRTAWDVFFESGDTSKLEAVAERVSRILQLIPNDFKELTPQVQQEVLKIIGSMDDAGASSEDMAKRIAKALEDTAQAFSGPFAEVDRELKNIIDLFQKGAISAEEFNARWQAAQGTASKIASGGKPGPGFSGSSAIGQLSGFASGMDYGPIRRHSYLVDAENGQLWGEIAEGNRPEWVMNEKQKRQLTGFASGNVPQGGDNSLAFAFAAYVMGDRNSATQAAYEKGIAMMGEYRIKQLEEIDVEMGKAEWRAMEAYFKRFLQNMKDQGNQHILNIAETVGIMEALDAYYGDRSAWINMFRQRRPWEGSGSSNPLEAIYAAMGIGDPIGSAYRDTHGVPMPPTSRSIAGYASGGVINRHAILVDPLTGMVIGEVGEGNQPEAIIPLGGSFRPGSGLGLDPSNPMAEILDAWAARTVGMIENQATVSPPSYQDRSVNTYVLPPDPREIERQQQRNFDRRRLQVAALGRS